VTDQNVELVRTGIYEPLRRGDIEQMLGVMADDIEWHMAEGMPYGEPPFRGPREVAEKVLGPISTDVGGFRVTPEQYVASGDSVVVIGRYTGTGKETGRDLDIPFAHLWQIRGGKCAKFAQFTDTAKFLDVVPVELATIAQRQPA
jgi:hypothetical protein